MTEMGEYQTPQRSSSYFRKYSPPPHALSPDYRAGSLTNGMKDEILYPQEDHPYPKITGRKAGQISDTYG